MSLSEGLARTIDYFRREVGVPAGAGVAPA